MANSSLCIGRVEDRREDERRGEERRVRDREGQCKCLQMCVCVKGKDIVGKGMFQTRLEDREEGREGVKEERHGDRGNCSPPPSPPPP